ncbi:Ig-like domain repeat protein [Nocardioides sp.]|uniref:Ig-like domain repeat protein n=1 Tax=Nocardioides sp. TaxID=35761 RepID=UPI0039E3C6A8
MRKHTPLAAVVAAGLAAPALALAAAPAHADEVTTTTAQLRWGINDETNNKAYYGFNFLSAGKIGNPGAGGQQLSTSDSGATWGNGQAAGWSARTGNVTIEKLRSDGSYAVSNWASRNTDPATGSVDASVSDDVYADTQVVLDAGTGTLDPDADDATLSWDGDFTVLYYSGMTFFYVSDPVLNVTGGVGTVTATLGGYGTSMDDTTQWSALDDTEVTLATLSDVEVTETGIAAAEVDYLGVTVDTGDGEEQATDSDYYGSFPQSFVDFQQLTGQSSYWYSSGTTLDKGKVALPLTVLATATPTEAVVDDTGSTATGTTAPATSAATVSAAFAKKKLKAGKSAVLTVSVASTAGTPDGTVSVVVKKGKRKVAKTLTLAGGKARLTLTKKQTKKLGKGRWKITVAYAGSDSYAAASAGFAVKAK